MHKRPILTLLTLGLLSWAGLAAAQTTPAQAPAPSAAQDRTDRQFNTSQPDFTVVDLPTTLRMPRHKSSFRVTHRFGRPLGSGNFSDLASDAFGLDNGAQIGIEYRFGVMRGLYAGVARTSDKTIEFFGQRNLLQQSKTTPVGLGVLVGVDGTDNFSDQFSPSLGATLSRELGGSGALYVEPMWVGNVNLFDSTIAAKDYAVVVGLGGRLRVRRTVYVVGEVIPRLAGYDAGVPLGTFGIEKRAGGHLFQLNFSNGLGTTTSQLARGGTGSQDWYFGFNISRKFF